MKPPPEHDAPWFASAGRAGSREPGSSRRVVFDLTTTVHWSGPPVGIVRVESKFALWAHREVPGLTFAIFNPRLKRFDVVESRTGLAFLDGGASIDLLGHPDPGRPGPHRTEQIPAWIRPASLWVLQFRRKLVQALERRRLRATSERVIALIEALQRPLITRKYHRRMYRPEGRRRAYVPLDLLHANALDFQPGDILVCTGAGWVQDTIGTIIALQVTRGVRFVLLCHDIIPLLLPNYYRPRDAKVFFDYMRAAFAVADLVVFTSRTGEADARAYCLDHGINLRSSTVSPLGAEPVPALTWPSELPADLRPGRYALLASTIEPRKGHRMIYEVWLRLLNAGIPQAAGFKMVFVGRAGWMVDELMQTLESDPRTAGSLHVMANVSDDMLVRLYRGAAFCLYPSLYEGYGLPVVESFLHGKAVLASAGGALPELVGKFSPCLDANDPDHWYEMLRLWIQNPTARAPYEMAIRTQFRHPTWSESAASFFAAVERALPG